MKLRSTRGKKVLAREPTSERRMAFPVLTALLAALCVSSSGCNYRPDDYVQFRKLPVETQNAEFKRLPVDKQIDYYLYNRSHDLPAMPFDEAIASQGEAILPDLLRRLKAEPADHRRTDLISLFRTMHRNYLPLNENKEVITTLEQVIGQMKDPDWKEMSQKSLATIKADPDTPVPFPSPMPAITP